MLTGGGRRWENREGGRWRTEGQRERAMGSPGCGPSYTHTHTHTHTYTHTHLLQPGLNGCQFILAQSESLAFFLSKVTEFSRSSLVFFFFFFWTHKPDFPLSFYFTGLEKKSRRERASRQRACGLTPKADLCLCPSCLERPEPEYLQHQSLWPAQSLLHELTYLHACVLSHFVSNSLRPHGW